MIPAVREVVYEDEHLFIEELPEARVVIVRRLPTRADPGVLADRYREALASHATRHRGWGLVLDLREAPGRSEEGFEKAMAPLNAAARKIFSRVVSLVGSAAGQLQVNRIARQAGWEALVARDEATAIELCRPPR